MRSGTSGANVRWGRLVPTLRELLGEIGDEAPHLMVITDEDGRLSWFEGIRGFARAIRDRQP